MATWTSTVNFEGFSQAKLSTVLAPWTCEFRTLQTNTLEKNIKVHETGLACSFGAQVKFFELTN